MKSLFLFLCLIISIPLTGAPTIRTVGIPTKDFPLESQRQSNWCWAASVKMVALYNQLIISQEDIVERTFGRNYNGILPNNTGSAKNMSDNLNNWGVTLSRRKVQMKSTFVPRAPTSDELIQFLSREQPIILSYRSGPSMLHAVVIINCKYEEENGEKNVIEFTVADPWPSGENSNQAQFRTYSYPEFKHLMTDYFLVNVTQEGQTYISSQELESCKTEFCQVLNKYIKGLSNKFIDLRGKQIDGSQYNFQNGLALPGQRSNIIFTQGRFPEAAFFYYQGDDFEEAKRIFGMLEDEMTELGNVEEIEIEPSNDRNGQTKFEFVVDYVNEIRVSWTHSKSGSQNIKVIIRHRLPAGDF